MSEQLSDKNISEFRGAGVPADRRLVEELFSSGRLSTEAYREAIRVVQPPHAWGLWAYRLLLSTGCALLLAGIVFFFAYNWAAMSDYLKLYMIQGGIVLCIGCVLWKGPDSAGGEYFSLSASLLVGVYLAVFGQIFQTGADSYQLFRGWALLILPWVLIVRFAPLWGMWIVIVNVGLALFWAQVVSANSHFMDQSIFVVLALFNGMALVAREFFVWRGSQWLEAKWFRIMLAAFILVALFIPAFSLIVDMHRIDAFTNIGALMMLAALVIIYFYYRHVSPDIAVLGLAALCVCALICTAAGRFLGDGLRSAPAFFMLLMAIVVLGVFTTAALWLQRQAKEMRGAGDGR